MDVNETDIAQLEAEAPRIAADAIQLQWMRTPELESLYGNTGRQKCEEDTRHHLSYLFEAVRASSYVLFREYIAWAKILLENLGLDTRYFRENLQYIAETLGSLESSAAVETAVDFLEQSVRDLPSMPSAATSFLLPSLPQSGLAARYPEYLIGSNRRGASELILSASSDGVPVKTLFRYVFEPVMREVGRLWQMNQLSVAQEHFCTATTQMIICQLYPQIFSGTKKGKVFLGTCVSSELHELGIRMVTDSFELGGWDTHYLGANTPASSIADHLIKTKADVLGISATVTPHIAQVRRIITKLRSNESLKRVKVLVGGYPFNQDPTLWKATGADGWAADIDQAIELASRLTSQD